MREDVLLQHIQARVPPGGERIVIPPGDDMGAMNIGGAEVLVTVDQLAAGVHADLETTPLEKFARKAIARNLSDVAAMAALPCGAVAAVCLPGDLEEAGATTLFDAMREAAERMNCPLVGGDISIWAHPLIATVTVFAEPAGIEPVLRHGARPGDGLYVTGALGGSREEVAGRTHHLDFTPRIEPARELAGTAGTRPHAMIDLSDGLAKDLPRLCRASGVRAEVWADRLPIRRAAERASKRTGRPVWQHAVGDGEDYELLWAAPPGAMPGSIASVAITGIGRILEPSHEAPASPLVRLRLADGTEADWSDLGWEHHT